MFTDYTFGEWLKQRRKTLDLTQRELGQAAACSMETIRKLEAGGLRPSRQLADLLAVALRVPPEEQLAFVSFARDLPADLSGDVPSQLSDTEKSPPPTNLRVPPTTFIGREREVGQVREMLASGTVRLLTLLGPPGIGKTRLSIAVASGLEGWDDGIFFVALSQITDPSLVVPTIAGALGVREVGERPLLKTLEAHLSTRKLLLVLDNFEQIIPAGRHVAELLAAAPGLKVLVSSRELLHVYGEDVFPVPPLSLPDLAADVPLGELSDSEAVRLFVARAKAARPDFSLTHGNAAAIAGICARLDCLPLGIELAATRVKVLSPEAIRDRLAHSLDLLTSGAVDLPPRQQTLRGAIAWSDSLLSTPERELFYRVSVFVGGCTVEAAEDLFSGPQAGTSVLDLLQSLVDKSLLRLDASLDEPRFRMLQTIREYALEKLEESGDAALLRDSHALYFMRVAETAEGNLQGPLQGLWLVRLEGDIDNLRAAITHALGTGNFTVAARIAGALRRFWYLRGYLSEGRRRLNESMSGKRLPPDLLAKTLHASGTLAWSQGDYNAALELFRGSLKLRREIGDKQGIADMLNNLGVVALPQGDLDTADAMHEEALALFRELGDAWGTSLSLSNLGLVALSRGDYPRAESLLDSSLALRRGLGDKQSTAQSLNNLGTVMRIKGDLSTAFALHSEGMQIFRELDDRWSIALSLANLGLVRLRSGLYSEAAALLRDALVMFRDLDVMQGIATCLEGLAAACSGLAEHERSAYLFGAAEALREQIKVPLPIYEQAGYREDVARARSTVEATRFDAFWKTGRSVGLDRAVSAALREIFVPAAP